MDVFRWTRTRLHLIEPMVADLESADRGIRKEGRREGSAMKRRVQVAHRPIGLEGC